MRWPWSQRAAGSGVGPAAAEGRIPDPADAVVEGSAVGADQTRPVWLLDVDGVLNASRPGWGGDVAEGYATAGGHRFWIRWSPALVDRINGVARGGSVEVRWATTWVPWIDEIERLLGLPDWRVAWDGPYEGAGTPAVPTPIRKVQAALQVVEHERRPLIWTDDDAIPSRGREHDRIMAASVPCLLVRPASRAGLQPSDLDAIEDFVRRYG